MSRHGKKYVEARGAIDRERLYSPVEAVRLVKSLPGPNFDETVEVHFYLGLNVRHAEQQLGNPCGQIEKHQVRRAFGQATDEGTHRAQEHIQQLGPPLHQGD